MNVMHILIKRSKFKMCRIIELEPLLSRGGRIFSKLTGRKLEPLQAPETLQT
jgi:hypothetical protein